MSFAVSATAGELAVPAASVTDDSVTVLTTPFIVTAIVPLPPLAKVCELTTSDTALDEPSLTVKL